MTYAVNLAAVRGKDKLQMGCAFKGFPLAVILVNQL